MYSAIGYLLLSLAAIIAGLNLYLSVIRGLIYWFQGWQYRHVSGLPLLGSLLLVVALVVLEKSPSIWIIAIIVSLLDTGGAIWLLLTISWMTLWRAITRRRGLEDCLFKKHDSEKQ